MTLFNSINFSKSIIALSTLFLITEAGIAEEKELATPMAQLQQLTHKLNLATHHNNPKLARFYLEESLIMLADIQENIPEYRRLPIAIFIDRFAKPAYEPLKDLLREENKEHNPKELKSAMQGVVKSCNACHAASKFDFIKIKYSTNNPYNQDFKP